MRRAIAARLRSWAERIDPQGALDPNAVALIEAAESAADEMEASAERIETAVSAMDGAKAVERMIRRGRGDILWQTYEQWFRRTR